MHLQKGVAGAGNGQLEEGQADTPSASRGYRQGEQKACWWQVVSLDALTSRIGAHVQARLRRDRASVLSRPKCPLSGTGARAAPARAVRPPARKCDCQFATPPTAVEQPVAVDEGAARRTSWCSRARGAAALGSCACAAAARGRRTGSGWSAARIADAKSACRRQVDQWQRSESGGCAGRGEELKRRIRPIEAHVRRRACYARKRFRAKSAWLMRRDVHGYW